MQRSAQKRESAKNALNLLAIGFFVFVISVKMFFGSLFSIALQKNRNGP